MYGQQEITNELMLEPPETLMLAHYITNGKGKEKLKWNKTLERMIGYKKRKGIYTPSTITKGTLYLKFKNKENFKNHRELNSY